MILATKHNKLNKNQEVALFLDLDLSILGQEKNNFRGIQQQYSSRVQLGSC